jgi:antitoxin component YwqK of YwqJK toxin-antitoxin module
MKKFFLAICLALFAAAAVYAQSAKTYTYDVDAFYDEDNDLVIDAVDRPITGILKDYYENGKVNWEAVYKNGVKEGVQKFYFENGKLLQQTPYKNGKREGHETLYFENGKPDQETFYKNDKAEGILKSYFRNGGYLEFQYKDDYAVSGACVSEKGKRTPLTAEEVTTWNDGGDVECP